MNILLLSCSTGEGHNSAAKALARAAEKMGIPCQMQDPVALGSAYAGRKVSSMYNTMIKRTPKLFGAVYQVGALYEKTGFLSPVYGANALYAKRLERLIREQEIDAVISTHLYGLEAMAAVRKRRHCPVKSYGVLTDYTCIPFFSEPEADGYFIPHRDLIPELIAKGIPESRIYATGIPVHERFCEHPGKAAAREALGFSQEQKMILIMSGGVGCAYAARLCKAFFKNRKDDTVACVLAGRNRTLQSELKRSYAENSVRTVGFTDQVPLYMEAADVVITKPGGLTSTEAAVFGIPLVHIQAIPGCETANIEFFASHGYSVKSEGPDDAVRQAIRLAEDRQEADKMVLAQRSDFFPNAAETILKTVVGS